MNKSLTPLIILFSVIILTTMIVVQYHSRPKVVKYQEKDLLPSMALSHFSGMRRKKDMALARDGNAGNRSDNSEIDSKRLLREARVDLAENRELVAEDKLRTVLVFEPDNYPALSLLGGILYHTQRYQDAEYIFRQQIQARPDHSTGYSNLGSLLAKQKKYDKAIALTELALKKNPKDPSVNINLASIHSAIGNLDLSVKYFARAYELVGHRIIPLSYDSAFDNVRSVPEFQRIIQMAERDLRFFQSQMLEFEANLDSARKSSSLGKKSK